jgi:NAD+ diphosphatase
MLGFRARAVTRDIVVDGVEIEEAYWFEAEQLSQFGEWGDDGDYFCLPRRDSIARYLVNSWMNEVLEGKRVR